MPASVTMHPGNPVRLDLKHYAGGTELARFSLSRCSLTGGPGEAIDLTGLSPVMSILRTDPNYEPFRVDLAGIVVGDPKLGQAEFTLARTTFEPILTLGMSDIRLCYDVSVVVPVLGKVVFAFGYLDLLAAVLP